MTGAPFPRHSHLRLIPAPAPPPPRPRRIEVRIAVNAARAPYGRSRIFYLTNHDLERLLAHAESLDRRSS
jgi:hypothetical protein